MTKLFAWTTVLLASMLFTAGWIWAAEKDKKSCDVQLAEASVRLSNVGVDRSTQLAEKEAKIAELQVALYLLTQQKQALEKQVEALTPKPDRPETHP